MRIVFPNNFSKGDMGLLGRFVNMSIFMLTERVL